LRLLVRVGAQTPGPDQFTYNETEKRVNVLSLFSGIGGLELGLERAGMTVVGQVEIDEYCRRVLAKHWPEVPRHDDVRTAVEWWQSEPRPGVDVVAGGFPCQPFSTAGLQRGVADERWLWPPMRDVIRAVRPRYVLVENVAALLNDGDAFGTVLADLHESGFDAGWSVVSACAMGAPHTRERLFLVAYPAGSHVPHQSSSKATAGVRSQSRGGGGFYYRRDWLPEPDVDRVAVGIPIGLVRDPLHAYGNVVVPQVSEHVGRLLVEFDQERAA
jgi:DNA (cytosine-5)-methyltransferase 1